MSSSSEPEITLSEGDGLRFLHFGTEWVQGAMKIVRPNELAIEYTRQMMAWLLFMQSSQSILQIGLGAASLTRFCHARLPESRVTVVETSERVIQVAKQWFRLPPLDDRLEIIRDDGEDYLRK